MEALEHLQKACSHHPTLFFPEIKKYLHFEVFYQSVQRHLLVPSGLLRGWTFELSCGAVMGSVIFATTFTAPAN